MKNQIVIIGGGMVGAATALKLAKQGHQITVIEHQPVKFNSADVNTKPDIRVSAINRFSENLLQQLGAMSVIKQNNPAPYSRLSCFENLNSQLEFKASDLGLSHLGHIIENNLIQASLWQQFENHDIKVITDAGKLVGLMELTDRIEIQFENIKLTADLVVAADGGQSYTRKLAGIGVTGWQYQQSCMGVLIKLDAPQQDITWQQFKTTGPVAFLPLTAPYACLIWYHASQQLASLNTLDKAQLKQQILTHFPALAGDFNIEQQAVFPLTRQHANQYFKGRVVLVGDAAHTINPLAGQGVNLGFKDVEALAVALDGADDVGCEQLLKQYQSSRRNANLLMMSTMDACYGLFSNDITPLRHIRQLGLKWASKAGPIKNLVLKYAIGEV